MMDPIQHRPHGTDPRPATVPSERLAARFADRRAPLTDARGAAPPTASGFVAPQPAGLAIVHGTPPGGHVGASAVLPLAPGRWLAVHETLPDGVRVVEQHGGPAVAEDVSHGYTRIRVQRDDARRVLASGVALDLHPTSFPVGASAATAYREVFVVLHAVADDVFDLYVLRSFARSLWRWLHAAADA